MLGFLDNLTDAQFVAVLCIASAGLVALASLLDPALDRRRAELRAERFAADHSGRTRLNDPANVRGQRR